MSYLFLSLAILCEVTATSTLKLTEEFTRLFPSFIVIAGYLSSLYFMTLSLRTIPVGIVYATWSGVGIVLITSAGYFFYNQRLDVPAMLGIALIISGVVTIRLFSATSGA